MSLEVPLVRFEVTGNDDPLCRIGLTLWVAGCARRCPGCQNPELQDAAGYETESTEVICDMVDGLLGEDGLVDSVIFLGGDWMMYPEAYVEVARYMRNRGLSTVLYTGCLFEELSDEVKVVSDWVIDGPWDASQPGVFPASRNQRVFLHGIEVDAGELPLYEKLLSVSGEEESS